MIKLEEKKPSKQRRVKDFIAKYLVYNPMKRGKKVWQKLDEQLPEAVGATINDKPRLKKFQELIKNLSFLDYYALKIYLRKKYILTEDASYGLHTGREEQYCSKWMQIFSQHYNVME